MQTFACFLAGDRTQTETDQMDSFRASNQPRKGGLNLAAASLELVADGGVHCDFIPLLFTGGKLSFATL